MTPARKYALAAFPLAAAFALTGCGTVSSLTAPASHPPSSTAPAAAPSSSALAAPPAPTPDPSPSEVDCTSHACIISDARSLIGGVAKDESVMTAMSCQDSTVKHLGPGIWSVRCAATYSDGSVWDGIATVLLTSSQVTWEATEQVQ